MGHVTKTMGFVSFWRPLFEDRIVGYSKDMALSEETIISKLTPKFYFIYKTFQDIIITVTKQKFSLFVVIQKSSEKKIINTKSDERASENGEVLWKCIQGRSRSATC